MTYRFKTKESVAKGIKRISTGQVDKAINELNHTDESGIDEAVHQARKRLKKTRAVVRLVRDRLGKKAYRQENSRFRDLGRNLANLRDSKVQIKSLTTLLDYYGDTVDSNMFTDISRELQVEYRQEYQRIIDEDVVSLVKHQLKDAKDAIADWKIGSKDWSAIDKSIKRVYRRGYKGLHQVMSNPTAENLHDWRKRVKYLRYHLCILRPIWTETIEAWVNQTHELSDYLGDEHDLAVLEDFVLSQPERFDRGETLETLTALIDRRRAELQSAAIFLGNRIYTEKPGKFIDRLSHYWKIWQQETQQQSKITLP